MCCINRMFCNKFQMFFLIKIRHYNQLNIFLCCKMNIEISDSSCTTQLSILFAVNINSRSIYMAFDMRSNGW